MKLDKAAVARIKNATPKKQKGASAIEYLVLAGVVIAIIVAVFASGNGEAIETWFNNTIMSQFTTTP